MTNEKNVAFTGHRDIPHDKIGLVKQKITEIVAKLYNNGRANFFCGMALGFDMLCAEVVLEMKIIYPGIRLICVLPYKLQSEKWTVKHSSKHKHILEMADEVVVLSEYYYRNCFFRRNDYLIEKCTLAIAYYDGKQHGGTYYTLKKAAKKGVQVINLYQG